MAKWRPPHQCCLGGLIEECPLDECPGNEQLARTLVRDAQILALRRDGLFAYQIAERVGCSLRTVHMALGRCKRRLTAPAGRP